MPCSPISRWPTTSPSGCAASHAPIGPDAGAEWLEVVGLPGHGDRYPHELSGGERQRVALARALAPRPRLMLLDEPFASLDPNLRGRLRTEITDVLRLTGTPALFVTHDQADALTVGDRVAVMRAGRIEQLGRPDEVFHRPTNRFVAGFMGEAAFLPVDDDRRTELGPLPARQVIPPRAELVVRPDDITIVTDPDAAPDVAATVVAAEFRGPTRAYTLRLPSGAVVVSTQPHDTHLDVGAGVRVALSPGEHAVIPRPDDSDETEADPKPHIETLPDLGARSIGTSLTTSPPSPVDPGVSERRRTVIATGRRPGARTDQPIGRRARTAGSRPAISQPTAPAATGVPMTMIARSSLGSGVRLVMRPAANAR